MLDNFICKLRNTKYKKLFFLIRDLFFYYRYFSFCILSKLLYFFKTENKVIASSFYGAKYDDNTKYIVEALHKLRSDVRIIWLVDSSFNNELPNWIEAIQYNLMFPLRFYYEYITSKVWLDTHHLDPAIKKKNNQLFIETWHGGLGIKKIELDIPEFSNDRNQLRKIKNTSNNADFFISNSDFLSNIYRRAFAYKGKILKLGYPKNDSMYGDLLPSRLKVRNTYNISLEKKIALYAPTFRDTQRQYNNFDMLPYNIDLLLMKKKLEEKFGGDWVILVRLHPFLMNYKNSFPTNGKNIINATDYNDMQELIKSSDFFITDYSSCIFDAALIRIPCFVYASDYKEYKQKRNTYFELNELPFPIAYNNDELQDAIRNYDSKVYSEKWLNFKQDMGLIDTDSSAKEIAKIIIDFIDNNNNKLLN